jgi:hypothetical protein
MKNNSSLLFKNHSIYQDSFDWFSFQEIIRFMSFFREFSCNASLKFFQALSAVNTPIMRSPKASSSISSSPTKKHTWFILPWGYSTGYGYEKTIWRTIFCRRISAKLNQFFSSLGISWQNTSAKYFLRNDSGNVNLIKRSILHSLVHNVPKSQFSRKLQKNLA